MVNQQLKACRTRLRFAFAYPQYILLGAGLLAFLAAGLQLFALPDREIKIEATEHWLNYLERSNRQAFVEQKQAPDSPEQARLKLMNRLPEDSALPTQLGRLIELAHSEGLVLLAGEYQFIADKNKLLNRYQINLPMQGSYSNLRRYIAAIRNDYPGLAIEDISLRRESIRVEKLNVQLRLVIFVRPRESR